jgi:hypothetical protein
MALGADRADHDPMLEPVPMILAEAVSIDGDLLLLLLVILIAMAVTAVAVVVAGFVYAYRAGRGSHHALTWWLVIDGIAGLSVLATRSVDLILVTSVVVGSQALVYAASRASAGTSR